MRLLVVLFFAVFVVLVAQFGGAGAWVQMPEVCVRALPKLPKTASKVVVRGVIFSPMLATFSPGPLFLTVCSISVLGVATTFLEVMRLLEMLFFAFFVVLVAQFGGAGAWVQVPEVCVLALPSLPSTSTWMTILFESRFASPSSGGG